jgi:hypothetical protein
LKRKWIRETNRGVWKKGRKEKSKGQPTERTERVKP